MYIQTTRQVKEIGTSKHEQLEELWDQKADKGEKEKVKKTEQKEKQIRWKKKGKDNPPGECQHIISYVNVQTFCSDLSDSSRLLRAGIDPPSITPIKFFIRTRIWKSWATSWLT